MPPNKALELTGRHPGVCEALQPPAARGGMGDTPGGRRSVPVASRGGRQLNAVSVRRRREIEVRMRSRIIKLMLAIAVIPSACVIGRIGRAWEHVGSAG